MRIHTTIAVLGALLLLACGCDLADRLNAPPSPSVPSPPSGPRLYVTDHEKGAFAVSPGDHRVMEQFPIAGGAAEVACTQDQRMLYATSPSSNNLVVFYTGGQLVGRVPVGTDPAGLALAPDDRTAYVANQGSNDVSVVTLSDRKEVARVPCGTGPFDVLVDRDGARFWVSLHHEGAVVAYDAATRRELHRARVGLSPYKMALDPDGRYLYVALFDQDEVAVLTRDTLTEAGRIKTGDGPYAVVASKSGRVFISGIESGSVTMVQRDAWAQAMVVPVGTRPYGMALTADEDQLYVALEGEGRVSVRNPADLLETATFSPGTAPTEVFSSR